MQVSEPVYWWLLTTLIIPIILHLYNKKIGKVKILGSIRWLKEIQPAQSNLRKIYQWPLLLIRLLLITTVILLMVDLSFRKVEKSSSKLKTLILIHPAISDTLHLRQLAEKWQNDSVHVHWLMAGFPLINNNKLKTDDLEIWSLIGEAEKKFKADSIHVIAPDRADYFSGRKPDLFTPVSFELITSDKDSLQLLSASLKKNEPELLWFESGPEKTEYKLSSVLAETNLGFSQVKWLKDENVINVLSAHSKYNIPLSKTDTLRIAFDINKNSAKEFQILKSAFSAIADFNNVPVLFLQDFKNADWLVFFNDENENSSYNFDLVWKYHPVESVNWLEQTKNEIVVKKKLSMSNVLKGGLLNEIRPYILNFKFKHIRKPILDYRQQGTINNITNSKSNLKNNQELQAFSNYRIVLGLLALLLFIIERLWPKK